MSVSVRGNAVQREKKMSYADFVWFLISEEDKKSPTRYWRTAHSCFGGISISGVQKWDNLCVMLHEIPGSQPFSPNMKRNSNFARILSQQ